MLGCVLASATDHVALSIEVVQPGAMLGVAVGWQPRMMLAWSDEQ